jgi:hypothetical protein
MVIWIGREADPIERTEALILLPSKSGFGGDIFLLPDVVALFSSSTKNERWHSKSDLDMLLPQAFPFGKQLVDLRSPMQMLHSGIALTGVVSATKRHRYQSSETTIDRNKRRQNGIRKYNIRTYNIFLCPHRHSPCYIGNPL